MTISEVSQEYGLTPDTLRYYERIGLLPAVNRADNGNRDYTEENCRWVYFIKCMRNAGVAVDVLIEYVELFQQGDSTTDARKQLLIEQRQRLAERIQDMQTVLARLDFKIERYEQRIIPRERELLWDIKASADAQSLSRAQGQLT